MIKPYKKYKHNKMLRKEIYTLDVVLSKVRPHIPQQPNLVIFDDDEIDMESQRYILFKRDGCKCIKCNLEGAYFAKEKSKGQENSKRWHFNLYGIKDGKEVLFTKDHIQPKSLGGKDIMSNYQVMCSVCNHQKRNLTDEVFMGINFLPEDQIQMILTQNDIINMIQGVKNVPHSLTDYINQHRLAQWDDEYASGWDWDNEKLKKFDMMHLLQLYYKITKKDQ